MALALEEGVFTWQKVKNYLTTADEAGASAAALDAFRIYKDYLVCNRGNPLLQFVPFSAADLVQATGVSPVGVPCKLYALYAKNSGGSGGTDSYLTVHNAADNASVPFNTFIIQDDNDEVVFLSPRGVAFGTDITISGATTAGGATETVLEADAANGFVILGAA